MMPDAESCKEPPIAAFESGHDRDVRLSGFEFANKLLRIENDRLLADLIGARSELRSLRAERMLLDNPDVIAAMKMPIGFHNLDNYPDGKYTLKIVIDMSSLAYLARFNKSELGENSTIDERVMHVIDKFAREMLQAFHDDSIGSLTQTVLISD